MQRRSSQSPVASQILPLESILFEGILMMPLSCLTPTTIPSLRSLLVTLTTRHSFAEQVFPIQKNFGLQSIRGYGLLDLREIRSFIGARRSQNSFEEPQQKPNNAVQITPVPAGLLAYLLLIPLRGQEIRQKQAGASDRGRWAMKYLSLLIAAAFVDAAFADTPGPDADVFANRDWEISYAIDLPTTEQPKYLPPPWKIQELAANSSRVWLNLWQDGMMYFMEPGLDDGDNPLKLPPAETKKILAAVCRLLQSSPESEQVLKEKDVFTITVELRSGDEHFQYSNRSFHTGAQLPRPVFNMIRTMQPYSPAWTRKLK